MFRLSVSSALIVLGCAPFTWAADAPDFDRQVAPLLAAHCLDCHSGAEPKGGLDLSRSDRATKGGDSGAAITPGDAEQSLLWERVADDEMPPKKPLATAEKKILQTWLASGAKWGTDPIDPYRATSVHRAGYDWWSLQPIKRPPLPAVKNDAAVWNDVDRFIVAKLEEHQLAPSPAADRRTLIRRVTFDLLGLPPTPEEVEAFVRDQSPQAYAKVVDRLLNSPHYGERWARHWLDVAHFGESDGFEYDRMRPNAWPYRDWVINALNRDMPFDEFARLQIAGDVLRPTDAEAITAAGFLVHGAHDALMPAGDAMKQIMRQDELEDIVCLVGQTFLGLTVHCARCHDHKFDPITAEDYYRLASSLSGVRRGDRPVPTGAIPAELPQQLAALQKNVKQLDESARQRVLALRGDAAKKIEPPPALLRWVFDRLSDESGGNSLRLEGEAKLVDGGLVLDGKRAFAATAPFKHDLREKTLEAWVRLDNLEQRGGGVMSLQTLDGQVFDAIVFGERDPGQWMAGSDFFKRTQGFAAPQETEAKHNAVHLAIVYAADGTITAYRNGEPYGKPYKSEGPVAFKSGEVQVVFGVRHTPPGGNKMLAGRIERAAIYDRALTAEEVAQSAAAGGNIITQVQLLAVMTKDELHRRGQWTAQINDLNEKLSRLRNPQVYTIKPQQPEGPTHLLLRGSPAQQDKVISPDRLSALKTVSQPFGLEPTAPEGERRRKLAEWITHRDNPLFARTIANRLWHYHFGRGLIETPSDLGFNGGQPSHAELLDYLASELAANGWRLKPLHRLIVLSATYQQASLPRPECLVIDRSNRLLWRYAPRRLEAEAVRDAALMIAGELNAEMGGPSFHDFRPYDNHNAQYYEPIDPVGAPYHRRSIYRMWARGGKSPLLDTLDCPDPSTATPQRGSTTTPQQALALLNNSFMLRMADSMAARLKKDAGENAKRQIDRAFILTYARPPSDEERRAAVDFVSQHGLAPFCRVLLNTNGFLYGN
jgi:hypothetical protein